MNIKKIKLDNMKVFVQVIDTKTAVYQHGMIEEPIVKGSEIINALKHFGVIYGEVEWYNDMTDGDLENKPHIMTGNIIGTTKIVNVVAL